MNTLEIPTSDRESGVYKSIHHFLFLLMNIDRRQSLELSHWGNIDKMQSLELSHWGGSNVCTHNPSLGPRLGKYHSAKVCYYNYSHFLRQLPSPPQALLCLGILVGITEHQHLLPLHHYNTQITTIDCLPWHTGKF